ncbi:mechanosensitive ion channel domain-containing protein, partial [Amaricoccus sp.]|uniref:mechanosensitive ion channel family protein n=1 Tax=Amaricoccus sp. TaxID=1872485 RepID=UPI001B7A9BE9
DMIVRARFTAELRGRGPSPLLPQNWYSTLNVLAERIGQFGGAVTAIIEDPAQRGERVKRFPVDLLLAAIGVMLTFWLQRRLVRAAEGGLAHATSPGSIGLLVALRNFSRLIVPAVGAGLLFAALDPDKVLNAAHESRLFHLPAFALALIGASWLGNSLFSPNLPAYRLAPLDDHNAARGAQATMALGIVLAAQIFIRQNVFTWDLDAAQTATLAFPVFVAGGILLARASQLMGRVRRSLARPVGGRAVASAGPLTLGALEVAERGTMTVAVVAPVLAAVGYLAAASYLSLATILTLGLVGASYVVFDLLTRIFVALGRRRDRRKDRQGEVRTAPAAAAAAEIAGPAAGLVPVVVGAVVILAAIVPLALIWGARWSDVSSVLYTFRDGVTLGGMRISVGTLLTFAVVFGVIYGVARLLQSILRNTVLPRTRMDAGGRNAVLAGVKYVGFILAAFVAISSTGINLTSLAVVAGALSVGIGFGLQNIVSNFVSGIILLVERPIKEGDWIEVGGFSGYVRNISVRSTEIETFDRASVILPNSDLVAGTVLNRTHSGMTGRIAIQINVALESDPREVEAILLSAAEEHPLVVNSPSPRVLLMEVGPDSLVFEVRCWLRDVNFSLTAKSDINFDLVERLRAKRVMLQPYARAVPPTDHKTVSPAERVD